MTEKCGRHFTCVNI